MPASEAPLRAGPPAGPPVWRGLRGVRVTAAPGAIDAITWPPGAIGIRIAPDDAFIIDATVDDAAAIRALDRHAIIEHESMFHGAWLDRHQLDVLTDRLEWPLPEQRPALAQGMAAGLAIKLWLDADRTLLIVSSSVVHEVPERLGG